MRALEALEPTDEEPSPPMLAPAPHAAPNNRARVLIRLQAIAERWAQRGACRVAAQALPETALAERRAHTNVFFPGRNSTPDDVARAKAMCAGCPVRPECLAHALMNFEKVGVWGGETEQERRRSRRKLRAANAHGTEASALEWVLDHLYGTTPEDEEGEGVSRAAGGGGRGARPSRGRRAASGAPSALSTECA